MERKGIVDPKLLESLLQWPSSTLQPEGSTEMHKLKTASLIYDVWTEQGKDVSGLASR